MSKKIDLKDYTPTAWPLSGLVDDPLNKRTDMGDIESLAESIRTNGVKVPLLGRPTEDPDIIAVVWGKRRRLAAMRAGETTVPIVIRVMTDLEVLDAQSVENSDRKEFTPLEEAALYATYIGEHRLTIEQIAVRVSRSKKHVAARLRLRDLIPAAQEALAKGHATKGGMELGAAEALACFAPVVQDLALPHMLRTDATQPMDGAAARAWLADKFTLKLAKPPFDPEDGGLVPIAGKCSACPKRTGNQGELFADLAEDTCTDPVCYDGKSKAAWSAKAAEYEAKGYKVLDEEATKEVFSGGIMSKPTSPKYVSLDDKAWTPEGEKTYRQILGGKAAVKDLVLIARHPHSGQIFELLSIKDAASLAEERKGAGKIAEVPETLEHHTQSGKERRKLEKERAAAQERANSFVMDAVVGAIAGEKKLSADMWRLLARLTVDGAAPNVQRYVAERRAIPELEGRTPIEALHAHVEKLPIGGCQGLIFELGASRGMADAPALEPKRDGVLGQAMGLLGLEWTKVMRDATKHASSFGTGEGEKRKRKKKQETAKGKCIVCGCTDLAPCESDGGICTWIKIPEEHGGEGLCSACDEPINTFVETLRHKKGKTRIRAIVEEIIKTAPAVGERFTKGRLDAILTHLSETGVIWRDEKDVLLERDPNEQDEEDVEDEDVGRDEEE